MQLSDYIYWIDANLPPKAVDWLEGAFGVTAKHVLHINFLTAEDNEIFEKARNANGSIIIITKDEDFVELVLRRKPPPKVVWITVGNLSNDQLKTILLTHLPIAVEKLTNSENYFVEIR